MNEIKAEWVQEKVKNTLCNPNKPMATITIKLTPNNLIITQMSPIDSNTMVIGILKH